jgi:hypothetical protein
LLYSCSIFTFLGIFFLAEGTFHSFAILKEQECKESGHEFKPEEDYLVFNFWINNRQL